MTWKRRVRSFDLDAVGGLIAAGLPVVLHLLEFIEQDALLVVLTSLVALLLFRDLREETSTEELSESVANTERDVAEIRAAMTPPDVELVNPDSLRQVCQHFGRQIESNLVWFNLCLLMLSRQETFDVLVRPVLENPDVHPLRFI